MIKKIVLIVLSVLFGYLTYVAFMFGIDINLNLPFSTKVLPYKQIMTNGTTLNSKITRINTLKTLNQIHQKFWNLILKILK